MLGALLVAGFGAGGGWWWWRKWRGWELLSRFVDRKRGRCSARDRGNEAATLHENRRCYSG